MFAKMIWLLWVDCAIQMKFQIQNFPQHLQWVAELLRTAPFFFFFVPILPSQADLQNNNFIRERLTFRFTPVFHILLFLGQLQPHIFSIGLVKHVFFFYWQINFSCVKKFYIIEKYNYSNLFWVVPKEIEKYD